MILISNSWVQSGILKKYTENFKETTNQEITFDRIRLQWNGKLELTGVFIGDHHQDTLAFIQKIETSFQDFKKLQKNDFSLNRIQASGVFLNIKKYPKEEVHSLKVLFQKLQRESENRNKPMLSVEVVDLSKTKFNYIDLNIEQKPIFLDSLDVFAQNFNFIADSITFQLDDLKGYITSPFKRQIQTAASVIYHPGSLMLDNLKLNSFNNELIGSLKLSGANESFRDFNNKGKFELIVEYGRIDPKLIDKNSLFFGDKEPLVAQFSAKGSSNNFSVQNIKLNKDKFKFNGVFNVQNALDSKKTSWELTVLNAEFNTQTLMKKFDQFKQFKDYFVGNSLQFKGKLSSQNSFIDFELDSENTWAIFTTEGRLGNGLFFKKNKNRMFDFIVNIKNIDFFLHDYSNKKYYLGGGIQFNGDLNSKDNPKLNWNIPKMFLGSKALKLTNIALEGNFKNKQLRNTLSVINPLVNLKSDLRFDFSDSIPQYTLAANIFKCDINRLGLIEGGGKLEFKGVVLGAFRGKSIDHLEGEFKVSAAQITNFNKVVNINPIKISQSYIKGETQFKIINTDCISGFAKGNFKTSQLSQLFQQTLHQTYPFLPQKKPDKGQELQFNLKIYKKLLDALYPEFSISENIRLKGKIASDSKNSNISLDTPLLRWNSLQLEQLHFQIDTKNPIYNTFLSVDRITHDYISGRSFNMISTKLSDTLYFRSEFANEENDHNPFEINFYHTITEDGTSFFGFKKSKFPLGKETWILNPDDTPNQKISYNAKTKQMVLTDLLAVTKDQLIELSGTYLNKNKFQIDLDVDSVLLENFLLDNSLFKQSGSADLKLSIARSKKENQLDISASIADWNINGQKLGQFDFNANGNTLINNYEVAFNLTDDFKKEITAQGIWQGLENSSINLNLDFNDFNLNFLSPLGKEAIQKIGGVITGIVNLSGPINNIKHNGFLTLENAQIRIPYLNLGYQADNTQVKLLNQDFIFKDVKLFEQAENTSALFDGTFSHLNFRDWSLDMNIKSDRMLLLNTTQDPESLFFGKGFLDGSLSLIGPTKNLKISLHGETEKGTSIKIPWAENYGLSDNNFVNFIDKNKDRRVDTEDKKVLKEIRGLEMDFELDVTNDASVEIVIDQETGSFLSGRGVGNLFMEINTNGKFNIWGDFITFDGVYNFKNLGLIDKKFKVKPGGTIVWEGNPLEAQMALEAVYSVPGGANPALLLDNPNFNKSIPTEVLIRLQGNLLKPEDPVFEIDFPNTSGTVASEINYRLSDPQRSQLQAISLLSQGIFINEVSVSMQGITNNLYQKASDIVSNLIGEENDKLKVGIDYLQGDKSALLDIATEDRLGFTLSTKISDRILLNGKIGVPVGGVEQTLIVGNIQIDFILNDKGSLRAKVFNKENEFRYIGDELGYTQGVGLSYDVDFNTFKDLIDKLVASQTKEATLGQKEQHETSNSPVLFIKKNKL